MARMNSYHINTVQYAWKKNFSGFWWFLGWYVFLLIGCTTPEPVPTEATMDAALSGYPGAIDMQRSERVDVPDVITRYAFDTPDAQPMILQYYHDLVLQKGFVPSSQWGGAISADAYYLRKGCPTYGVLIAVDDITHHVVIEFSRNPCM